MFEDTFTVLPVTPALRPFLPQAVERLNYLYPQNGFEADCAGVRVFGATSESLLRDIHYALHRAKIAHEAAPLREMLFRSVLL